MTLNNILHLHAIKTTNYFFDVSTMPWIHIDHFQTLNLLSGGIICPLLPAWPIVWKQSYQKTHIIICQAHLLANFPTIPLMYNLVLWNNFLKK